MKNIAYFQDFNLNLPTREQAIEKLYNVDDG